MTAASRHRHIRRLSVFSPDMLDGCFLAALRLSLWFGTAEFLALGTSHLNQHGSDYLVLRWPFFTLVWHGLLLGAWRLTPETSAADRLALLSCAAPPSIALFLSLRASHLDLTPPNYFTVAFFLGLRPVCLDLARPILWRLVPHIQPAYL